MGPRKGVLGAKILDLLDFHPVNQHHEAGPEGTGGLLICLVNGVVIEPEDGSLRSWYNMDYKNKKCSCVMHLFFMCSQINVNNTLCYSVGVFCRISEILEEMIMPYIGSLYHLCGQRNTVKVVVTSTS